MLTKKDQKFFTDLYNQTRIEFTQQVEKFKQEIANLIQKSRSDNAKFKDEILKEISDLRDDMTVTKGYGDKLEDHEERIQKLEKEVVTP